MTEFTSFTHLADIYISFLATIISQIYFKPICHTLKQVGNDLEQYSKFFFFLLGLNC